MKIKYLSILLLCTSCASISPSLLTPTNNSLDKKILPLEMGVEEENVQRDASLKTITFQDAFMTVIQREFKKNITQTDTVNYGYLETKMTYDAIDKTGLGIVATVFNSISLFTLTPLGLPLTFHKREIQIEFNIFDSKKILVKNYIYTVRSKPTNYAIFIYTKNNVSPNNKDFIKGISILNEIMEKFKNDLSKDAETINTKLKETGYIKK